MRPNRASHACGIGSSLWIVPNGGRKTASDLQLQGDGVLAAGLWMDETTAWVANWSGDRLSAYLRSDGAAQHSRDITVASMDAPAGMWSNGSWMWVMNWQGGRAQRRIRHEHRRSRSAGWLHAQRPIGVQRIDGHRYVGAGRIGAFGRGRHMHATNLVRLDLGYNPVTDLWVLGVLGRLAVLNLDGVPGTDLSALGSLPGLRNLSLRDSALVDLTPLGWLAGLEALDIGGNAVADLRPLSGLGGLRRLMLGGNAVTDVGALSGLTNLEVLSLHGNRVEDLHPLTHLSRLDAVDACTVQARWMAPAERAAPCT